MTDTKSPTHLGKNCPSSCFKNPSKTPPVSYTYMGTEDTSWKVCKSRFKISTLFRLTSRAVVKAKASSLLTEKSKFRISEKLFNSSPESIV